MRVTSRSMVDTVVRNLQQNAQTLDRLQNQISSGKRITRPSDDPVAAWRGLRMRREQASGNQFLRNMDEARNWLIANERVLNGTSQALARLRELSVQAADDSYRASDRAAVGREVAQLRDHILSLFNGTTHVGQTLFGGRRTDVPPFSIDAGGNVIYNGESGITIPTTSSDLVPANGIASITLTDATSATQGPYRIAIAPLNPGDTAVDVTITRYDENGVAVPDATQTISVTIPAGNELQVVDFDQLGLMVTFNASFGTLDFAESATSEFTAGTAGISREIGSGEALPVNLLGSQFLTMFQDLKGLMNALNSNDQPAISRGIAKMDRAIEMVLVGQAETGTRTNRLAAAQERLHEERLEVERIRGDVENLDMVDALTRLTTQQAIFRAALETGARTIPMSILDFLR